MQISIHTPRVGRDSQSLAYCIDTITFQSTRPVWGVTEVKINACFRPRISIHTPRVGRDLTISRLLTTSVFPFQSTRPVWGVTAKIHKFLCVFLRKQTKNFIFSKGKPFQNLFYREFIKEILKYGVRTHPGIYVYLCFALHNHRVLRHIRRFTAKMLYLLLILFSQIIKS